MFLICDKEVSELSILANHCSTTNENDKNDRAKQYRDILNGSVLSNICFYQDFVISADLELLKMQNAFCCLTLFD